VEPTLRFGAMTPMRLALSTNKNVAYHKTVFSPDGHWLSYSLHMARPPQPSLTSEVTSRGPES
jgi:hypothetical protein